MPLLSKTIKINDKKYLDGAISDSIPVMKALEMGYEKVVVITTQPYDYKKKELTEKEIKKFQKRYKKYPNFINAAIDRPKKYNSTLDKMKKLEKEKKIFVIRPSEKIEINPIKKNIEDLNFVYNLGLNDIKNKYKDLIEYLK